MTIYYHYSYITLQKLSNRAQLSCFNSQQKNNKTKDHYSTMALIQ